MEPERDDFIKKYPHLKDVLITILAKIPFKEIRDNFSKEDLKDACENIPIGISLFNCLHPIVNKEAPINTPRTITPADLQLKTVDEVINYYESLKTGNILDKILNKKRSLVNTDFSFRTRDNIDNELRTEAALQFQASLNTTQKKKEYRLLNIYGGAGIGKTRYGSEAVKILQKTKKK